jgi:DNA repair ATPase RecN
MVARSPKPKAKPKTKRSSMPAGAPPALPNVRPGGDSNLEALAARMAAACETLEHAALEAPKASDFEPLAEHLYSFAVSAPRLLESLEEVPKAAATIQASLASLREVAETLHDSNDRLADAVLKVPRAEDYEPLAEPLREFARVAPALAEALAEVLRVARPLADSVRELPALSEAIRSVRAAAKESARPKTSGSSSEASARALEAAADRMGDASESIHAALAGLPRDPEYGRFASQLREIAAVSPSLMEWLAQVPRLTAPLEESVRDLASTAESLSEARDSVLEALKILPREG